MYVLFTQVTTHLMERIQHLGKGNCVPAVPLYLRLWCVCRPVGMYGLPIGRAAVEWRPGTAAVMEAHGSASWRKTRPVPWTNADLVPSTWRFLLSKFKQSLVLFEVLVTSISSRLSIKVRKMILKQPSVTFSQSRAQTPLQTLCIVTRLLVFERKLFKLASY